MVRKVWQSETIYDEQTSFFGWFFDILLGHRRIKNKFTYRLEQSKPRSKRIESKFSLVLLFAEDWLNIPMHAEIKVKFINCDSDDFFWKIQESSGFINDVAILLTSILIFIFLALPESLVGLVGAWGDGLKIIVNGQQIH